MSAFLLRFKANYLEKMSDCPHFSLWTSIAQKPSYLVGTVLNGVPLFIMN